MREIKFRAWNAKTKEMGFVSRIIFPTRYVWLLAYEGEQDQEWLSKFDEVVLMQYTGLKDKNGTEIYEGDILHKDCFWSRFIEFEKGSFVSAPLNKVQYNNRKFYPIGCSDYQDWEIIGNIFENPEMLEA